jgi:hypothetical protein
MTDVDKTPDEPSGSPPFEQGDETIDGRTRLDPDFVEALEADPALDPTLALDDRELEGSGTDLDDSEAFATLEGGSHDPDGLGVPPSSGALALGRRRPRHHPGRRRLTERAQTEHPHRTQRAAGWASSGTAISLGGAWLEAGATV